MRDETFPTSAESEIRWLDAEIEVPISALEHYSYCPRQCALIHVEQTFDENVYAIRGHLAHERVDSEEDSIIGGMRILRGIPLWSERLGLTGKADVVEMRPGGPFPIEYKSGRPHGQHAELQLCGQALCLEEMLSTKVREGAIYFAAVKRRVEVQFTKELRQATEAAIGGSGRCSPGRRSRSLRTMLVARTARSCTRACHLSSANELAFVASKDRCSSQSRLSVRQPTPVHELQSVLYVMTQGAVVGIEHDALRVEVDGELRLRAPLLRLNGVVVFGRVMVSPFLIQRCAEDGRSLVWLDRQGRFKARIEGPVRGNVLLRRAQHQALSEPGRPSRIARQIVAAKIQNSRQVLLRGARESTVQPERAQLEHAAARLAAILVALQAASDLDVVRGCEGEAARAYYQAFALLVRVDRDSFALHRRTRRPPRDRINAVLSFLYALLRSECSAALEGVGLDPQVGYLHALRPGRPALALDLMEEFRPVIADRLALRLVNRRQLGVDDFELLPGGAVRLTDDGRRAVLVAYQKRKEESWTHRVLRAPLPIGLVPHVQARLLARHLRRDLTDYPPFLYR